MRLLPPSKKPCLLAHAPPPQTRALTFEHVRARAPAPAPADPLRFCAFAPAAPLENQASTKTADIKVQAEGCLTGATTDITPGGGTKQSVPVLGKCTPQSAATTTGGKPLRIEQSYVPFFFRG